MEELKAKVRAATPRAPRGSQRRQLLTTPCTRLVTQISGKSD